MRDKLFWIIFALLQGLATTYFILSYKTSCITIRAEGFPIVKEECSIERK